MYVITNNKKITLRELIKKSKAFSEDAVLDCKEKIIYPNDNSEMVIYEYEIEVNIIGSEKPDFEFVEPYSTSG